MLTTCLVGLRRSHRRRCVADGPHRRRSHQGPACAAPLEPPHAAERYLPPRARVRRAGRQRHDGQRGGGETPRPHAQQEPELGFRPRTAAWEPWERPGLDVASTRAQCSHGTRLRRLVVRRAKKRLLNHRWPRSPGARGPATAQQWWCRTHGMPRCCGRSRHPTDPPSARVSSTAPRFTCLRLLPWTSTQQQLLVWFVCPCWHLWPPAGCEYTAANPPPST